MTRIKQLVEFRDRSGLLMAAVLRDSWTVYEWHGPYSGYQRVG